MSAPTRIALGVVRLVLVFGGSESKTFAGAVITAADVVKESMR